MKKIILTTFFSFLVAILLIAQTTIEPNPSSAMVDPADLDAVAHSTIKNTGDKEETYVWTRTIIEITEGWETAVCDKNLCYIPTVETEMFTLGAGEEDILDVHVYPYGTAGQAQVELVLTKAGTTEELAKGIYLFNMDSTTGTLETQRTDLLLYPNPATESFQIRSTINVARLEVYNAIGKRVDSFTYQDGRSYGISNYPRGFYFVKVLNRQQETVSVKRLQKL